ncbi:MAG: DNA repair protein RecN [Leptothrix sp. (in: b-proteobacteria)]
MLKRLSLRDFVIVTTLEVDFSGGFAVLTGETGAGKSILIDALQLALGGRADAGVVREGAARCDISAEFDAPGPALQAWLDAAGFTAAESGSDDTLLLRRSVDAQGKSRGWINGSAATATQLRELGEQLVDIHGQHAWQSLTRAASVRELLDAYAGIDTTQLGQCWARWRERQAALDDARSRSAVIERERERLSWQITELAKLAPGADEWAELNAEHQRLAHAQAILDATRLALLAVSGGEDDDRGSHASDPASRGVDQAIDALQAVAGFEPSLANALEVLRTVQDQLADASHSLHAALRHTDLDPERLAELDARLSAWLALARRHRRPPEELPATLSEWRRELHQLDAAADLATLEQASAQAHAELLSEARRVSAARQTAAPQLSHSVTAAMQALGMAGGRFEVALEALAEVQAHGLEAAEFRVAGHAGSTPRPMAKVASGGELSRIALAIAVTTSQVKQAQGAAAGTLIFDEVDAGVGGAVAETVGRLMHQLGREHQVLAVTHLAQVAACADQHLVVSKQTDGGLTHSQVHTVQGESRVAEVARMLGGQQLSGASLAHAQAMLAAVAAVGAP